MSEFNKQRMNQIRLSLIELNDKYQSIVMPPSDVKHLLEATVELTKARQQHCHHLNIENSAKDIFEALSNEVMRVRQESLFGKPKQFFVEEHCDDCRFEPETNRVVIDQPSQVLLERLFNSSTD